MDKSSIDSKLWELRMDAVHACDEWNMERSINSTQDKISGFNDKDILMKPDAMHNMIEMLNHAKQTDASINDFGRSQLVKKKAEEPSVDDNILANFSRSVCVSQPEDNTAIEGVERNIDRNKKGTSEAEKNFLKAVKALESFMGEHNMTESFRCKAIHVDKESIDNMLKEANDIELGDESDRHKIKSQIKNIENGNLYDFCKRKPYQCLVCPYYYKDFPEFWEMKELRGKERRSVEDEKK